VVSEQQKAAAASATAAAQGLQVFGSLGSRLSSNINKKLSATAATAGVTWAKGDEEDYGLRYLNALNGVQASAGAKEDPAKVLEEASVKLGVPVEDLKAKFTPKGVESTLTDIYKAATPDKVTLGELFEPSKDAAGNVVESPDLVLLAQQTGKTLDEVKAMSAAEADEVFNQLQASAFSRASGIKAQLEDPQGILSPYQRETLLNELQTLYSSGAVSAEQLFEDTFQQVQAGQTIKVNGQDVRLEDYLKDEAVTEEIKAALVDPAKLESLLKENPDLGKWVRDNQASLTKILDTSTSAFETVGSAQKAYSDAWTDQGLAKALGLLGVKKAGVPAAEERATVTKYQNILNSFTSQGLSAEWENVSRYLNSTNVKNILDSTDPIKALKDANTSITAYESLPPWMQTSLKEPLAPEVNIISDAWLGLPAETKDLFNDPVYGTEVQKMFNTASLITDLTDKKPLFDSINEPSEVADFKFSIEQREKITSAKTTDDWLNIIFGTSVPNIGQELRDKLSKAYSNPGNPTNQSFINKIRTALGADNSTTLETLFDPTRLKTRVGNILSSLGLQGDITTPVIATPDKALPTFPSLEELLGHSIYIPKASTPSNKSSTPEPKKEPVFEPIIPKLPFGGGGSRKERTLRDDIQDYIFTPADPTRLQKIPAVGKAVKKIEKSAGKILSGKSPFSK
jgi:hypothetical protein